MTIVIINNIIYDNKGVLHACICHTKNNILNLWSTYICMCDFYLMHYFLVRVGATSTVLLSPVTFQRPFLKFDADQFPRPNYYFIYHKTSQKGNIQRINRQDKAVMTNTLTIAVVGATTVWYLRIFFILIDSLSISKVFSKGTVISTTMTVHTSQWCLEVVCLTQGRKFYRAC